MRACRRSRAGRRCGRAGRSGRRPSTSTRSASTTGFGRCGACTAVPSGCGLTRTPGSGVHASSRAVRRRAITQVSVEPNTSRTSQPKRASAAARELGGNGAVAETMPASGGNVDRRIRPARAGAPAWSPAARGASASRSACGDVLREERARAVHRDVAEQRQQHRHLHAVHVLRRHRGDRMHDRVVGPQAGQRGQVLRGAGAEAAPGLGVRLRRAGAAGGEADRDQRIVVDLRRAPSRCGSSSGMRR